MAKKRGKIQRGEGPAAKRCEVKDTKLRSAEREIRADKLSVLDRSSAVTNGASAKTGGSP